MSLPESMRAELAAWNGGDGIDLESWIGCSGTFSLAVGYLTVFWPEFDEIGGYILKKGTSEESIRSFEIQEGSTKKSVQWVLNHLHLADLQYRGCEDISADKLLLLGDKLKEIYEAKLAWQFPDEPCRVELYVPDDRDDFGEYQLSFWQVRHEPDGA